MSRLINADALIERLEPFKEKYGAKEFPYNMVHDAFVYEVEQEPTVEAIPIEWMLKWDDAPLTDEYMKIGRSVKTKENGRSVNWNTVKWIILEWRKSNG